MVLHLSLRGIPTSTLQTAGVQQVSLVLGELSVLFQVHRSVRLDVRWLLNAKRLLIQQLSSNKGNSNHCKGPDGLGVKT